MADGADLLDFQLRAVGITLEREYRFHPSRLWRLDLASLPERLAVEVEGGVFTGGRHIRGTGFTRDCEKYAELAILGWRLIRVTTDQVRDGVALGWIERALQPHRLGGVR